MRALNESAQWTRKFFDAGTGNWRDRWFLDGELATLNNTAAGMHFSAGQGSLAMTALKARQTILEKTCDNPVADQYALGKALGVRGTPAIILQDGTVIPEYKPADKMAEALGIKTGEPVKTAPAKE